MTKHIYSIQEIKSNAKIIKESLARFGVEVKHTHALEVSSAIAGYTTWNIASASAKDSSDDISKSSSSNLNPLSYLTFGQHVATVEPIEYSELVEATPIEMPEPTEEMADKFKEPRSIVVDRTVDVEEFPYAKYCTEYSVNVYGGYIDNMAPDETMYIAHSRLFALDPSDLTDKGYSNLMSKIAGGYDDAEEDFHETMSHPLILNRDDENELLVYVLEAKKGDDIGNEDYIAWVLGMGIVEVLDDKYFGTRTVKVAWPFYHLKGESEAESNSRLLMQMRILESVCKSGIFQSYSKEVELDIKASKIDQTTATMLVAVIK